jgi:hypothetical protein
MRGSCAEPINRNSYELLNLVGEEREERVNKDNRHKDAPKPALRQRDWRRIHHSPLFWVGFFLLMVAIAFYVLSDDLSWRPRIH